MCCSRSVFIVAQVQVIGVWEHQLQDSFLEKRKLLARGVEPAGNAPLKKWGAGMTFNPFTVFSFREFLTLNCLVIVVFEITWVAFIIKFLATKRMGDLKKKNQCCHLLAQPQTTPWASQARPKRLRSWTGEGRLSILGLNGLGTDPRWRARLLQNG